MDGEKILYINNISCLITLWKVRSWKFIIGLLKKLLWVASFALKLMKCKPPITTCTSCLDKVIKHKFCTLNEKKKKQKNN